MGEKRQKMTYAELMKEINNADTLSDEEILDAVAEMEAIEATLDELEQRLIDIKTLLAFDTLVIIMKEMD